MDQLPLTRPQLGTWPATQTCALTRNQTDNLSVRRPELNPLSHTSQGSILYYIFHSADFGFGLLFLSLFSDRMLDQGLTNYNLQA